MNYRNKARRIVYDFFNAMKDNDVLNEQNFDQICEVAKMFGKFAVETILSPSNITKLTPEQEKYWKDVKQAIKVSKLPG